MSFKKKPRDFIEKLFETPEQITRPGKIGMVVQQRAATSAEIDADEAAEVAAEKKRIPVAFWNGDDDTLEPLSRGDLRRLQSLGMTPWEWEIIVTENYLEMKEREADNE